MWRLAALAALAVVLSACVTPGDDVARVAADHGTSNPRPEAFKVCYRHGCDKQHTVSLTEAEWARVTQPFDSPAATPAEERRQIAYALREMEHVVGAKTGLERDRHGSFPGMFQGDQMDCIDEMVNTGTYLAMFERAELLHHYKPGRHVRAQFFGRSVWPHSVMSIVEAETGEEYIIDMWFDPHGALPYVMPVEDWADKKALVRAYPHADSDVRLAHSGRTQ